jgi:hypothetical protein
MTSQPHHPHAKAESTMGAFFSCMGNLCNTLANAVQQCFRSIGACCSGIVDALRNCVTGTCKTLGRCLSC